MMHIYCGAFGAENVENSALPPDQRPACPACGSTDRRFSVELTDTARAYDSLSVAVVRPVGIESVRAFGTPVVAHAEPAMVTATAHDATVEAEDGQTGVEVEEALVEQGLPLVAAVDRLAGDLDGAGVRRPGRDPSRLGRAAPPPPSRLISGPLSLERPGPAGPAGALSRWSSQPARGARAPGSAH
jgi:hypothetical protein